MNGGGVQVAANTAAVISHCHVCGNVAAATGGGIFCDAVSAPVITHNVIEGNSASFAGALYFNYDSTPPLIADNLIVGNHAGHAPGIAGDGTVIMFANNTLVGNSGADGSAALSYLDGVGTHVNNVLALTPPALRTSARLLSGAITSFRQP